MLLRAKATYLDGKLQGGVTVEVAGETIRALGASGQAEELPGYLLPGYIDVHIHGLHGADAMQGEEAVRRMAQRLPRFGVTGFLPTTMNAPVEDTTRALRGIAAAMAGQEGARVLGAHMEGPFLGAEHKGAQDASANLPPTMENFTRLTAGHADAVRLLTLAPELPGALELTRHLTALGVTVSAGHTGASYEVMREAAAKGVSQVTHLFNGMNALHHRAPGVPGAALTLDGLAVQLIADGVHLHPAALVLAARLKGPARTLLITDAMAAADMPDGQYTLGGQAVTVQAGIARIAAGNLAGSTLTMDRAVRNMVALAGCTPEDAIYMATAAPARSLGLTDTGCIAPGLRADLILVDESLHVLRAWVGGRAVYMGEA